MSQDDNVKQPSRRKFLMTGSGALLAAPLIPAAFPAVAQVPDFPLPELPGQRLGYAIVGLGQLAVNQILPALTKSKKSRVVALVSGRPEKARHLAQVFGVDSKAIYNYDNYEDMAKNPAIDVVYVVLPNSMHAEYTTRALKIGKHVLCEKPMANTPEECEQMIAAAKAANRKLMIGYRLHHEPHNLKLVEFARDAQNGPTKMILADAGFSAGNPAQWRLKRKMAGGGSMMDIGIYALQAARYLSGEEPVEVNAMTYSTPNDPRFAEVEEHINFQLRFPSGVLANCTSSYGAGLNRFRVVKPNSFAELEPALNYTGLKMRVFRRGVMEDTPQPIVDHFAAEMDHFSDCVMTNKDPKTPGEEGLRDMKIIMGIYEAARSGKTVKLA